MVSKSKPKKDMSDLLLSVAVSVKADSGFKQNLRSVLHTHYQKNTYYKSNIMKRFSFITQRKYLMFSLLVVAAFVTAAVAILPGRLGNVDEQKAPIGSSEFAEITYVEGEVEFSTEEDVWKKASKNTTLSEMDKVRVLGEGRAIIAMDDGSAVRLDNESSVELTSTDPYNIVVTNLGGEVYSRVVEADRDFTVVVDSAEILSLGTAYKTVNKASEKGVIVYQSDVAVKNVEDKEVIVKEGNKYFFKTNSEDLLKKVKPVTKAELDKDEFAQWNKEQDKTQFADKLGVFETLKEDKKVDEKKNNENEGSNENQQPTTPIQNAPSGSITVTSIQGHQGAFKVFWSSSAGAAQGFKINYSTSPNPTFGAGGTTSAYISSPSASHGVASSVAAGTYYVRVCRYTGSGCDTYSNQVVVTVTAPQAPNPVTSVSLSGTGASINWNVAGGPGQGYKIGWSKDASKTTYPTAQFGKFEGAGVTSTTITANDGAGTYYVTVCAWNGGSGCTAVSNQITVEL